MRTVLLTGPLFIAYQVELALLQIDAHLLQPQLVPKDVAIEHRGGIAVSQLFPG